MGPGLSKLALVASMMLTGVVMSGQATASNVSIGLDPSFGTGGEVTHALPFRYSSTESIDGFTDASGRLVSLLNFNVFDQELFGTRTGYVLARHTATGELDTTFGDEGATVPVVATMGHAVVALPNGNLVVGGNGVDGVTLRAFTSEGELLSSFGSNGIVEVDPESGFGTDAQVHLKVQGSRLIVVIRRASVAVTTLIKSFLFDGVPDTAYGTQGSVVLQVNTSVQDFVLEDIDVTNNDELLLLGTGMLAPTQEQINNSSPAHYAAVALRLTSSGAIDTTFANYGANPPGHLIIPPSGTPVIEGLLIAVSNTEVPADAGYGKFIVSGQIDGAIYFSRFSANGMSDTGFGNSGTLTTGISAANDGAFVFDMYLAPNGEVKAALIEVTGSPRLPTVSVLGISTSGILSWQSGLWLGVGNVVSVARILPESGGTFVVLASTDINQRANVYVRISAVGNQDMDYGSSGLANIDVQLDAPSIGWLSATKGPDGLTYLGGLHYVYDALGQRILVGVVSRLMPSGEIDDSFGVDGYAYMAKLNAELFIDQIVVSADGKIYVLATAAVGSNLMRASAVVISLNPNGSIDTTFDGNSGNGNGFVDVAEGFDINYGSVLTPTDIVVQSDGRIVVAGTAKDNNDNEFAFIQRMNGDGTLDTSFDGASGNGNGFVEFTFPNEHGFNLIQTDSSGNYLVAGNSNDVPFIGRVTSAGVFDTAFGIAASSGIRPIEVSDGFGGVRPGLITGFSQLSDGKILAVGSFPERGGLEPQHFVAKLTSRGEFDERYDGVSGVGNGLVVLDVDISFQEYFTGVEARADGSLVLVGQRVRVDSAQMVPEQTAIFLFVQSNGEVDRSFGVNGYFVIGSNAQFAGFSAIVPTGENEWIAVGFAGDYFIRVHGLAVRFVIAGSSVSEEVPLSPVVVPVVVPSSPAIEVPTTSVINDSLPAVPVVAVATPVKAVPKLVKPVVLRKKSVTRTALMKYMKLTMPKGSKVTITVSAKSKRYCKLSGTRVVYVRPGKCLVRVTVRPKKGIMRSATTTMLVKK